MPLIEIYPADQVHSVVFGGIVERNGAIRRTIDELPDPCRIGCSNFLLAPLPNDLAGVASLGLRRP